jgi:glycosyltransferase involved in cell wall biosynthesis
LQRSPRVGSLISVMKISVCIPAYKNADFLRRNLDALTTQTFKDFDVILSDDSPDESVATIAREYNGRLQIIYLKNDPAKGTPANWNFAMQHATGEFLKLMHDDDWFASDTALQEFYDCLVNNPGVDFCFSAFNNVHISSGKVEPVYCSKFHQGLLKKSRYNLFKRNFIGPPSVVFQRNRGDLTYDENLKWLVDFEGYIRFMSSSSQFVYLGKNLVNIGLSAEQVTTSTQHDRSVVLPESMYFLQKHGEHILDNVYVYDYYWRMARNFSIKNEKDILSAGWDDRIPKRFLDMIAFQRKIPAALLHLGPLSKVSMLGSYVINR